MKKSLSKTRKYHYILYIVPILSILTVLKTSALTYQSDTNIDFTINPTISMTISGDLIIDNLTPGSSSDSNIIEVGVSTNASHGYYLSATVGSSNTDTNLTNSENSNYKFTNLSSNASSLSNFSDNEWGYSYSTDGGTNWVSGSQGSTTSGYNGLPLDGNDSGATGITLVDTTTPLATNQVKFKIGAKASNTQASGTYTNTINFYAVTYKTPATIADTKYLQDVEECPSTLPTEKTYTLKDSRDEQEYTVAKLKDGKCWMTKNLNLAGGTKLTSIDTDMSNNYVLPTDRRFQTGNTLPESSSSGFSGAGAFVYNTGNNTESCSDNGCYSYYSWEAATLGSGINLSSADDNAPYSICPKSWKLPTGFGKASSNWTQGDFYQLAVAYGMNPSNVYQKDSIFYDNAGPETVPNFSISGAYFSTGFNGIYHRWWSSSSWSSTAESMNLYFNDSDVNSACANYRSMGTAIRCLFSS